MLHPLDQVRMPRWIYKFVPYFYLISGSLFIFLSEIRFLMSIGGCLVTAGLVVLAVRWSYA